MKFVLFVEGHTERKTIGDFLKKWLDARLKQSVRINVDRFDGYGDFWKNAPKKAQKYLDDPEDREIIGLIGLLDLYGPKFYPAATKTAIERCEWAVREIQNTVNRDKFRMFFAVHEYEAWILSDPNILPFKPGKKVLKKIAEPEAVDFEEPPSKLLRRLYKDNGRSYKKTTNGTELFKKLNPEVAYDKCPYLKKLLDEMLDMAQQTGA